MANVVKVGTVFVNLDTVTYAELNTDGSITVRFNATDSNSYNSIQSVAYGFCGDEGRALIDYLDHIAINVLDWSRKTNRGMFARAREES